MKKAVGFTLIEMMIVVVIVAILAAFAFPAYQDYVRKSKRADGMNYLLELQTLQEKHRASHTTYANSITAATNATPPGLGRTTASPKGYYNVALANATATGYTLTASALGDQQKDKGRDGNTCTALVLTVNAANPRGIKGKNGAPNDTTCWQ